MDCVSIFVFICMIGRSITNYVHECPEDKVTWKQRALSFNCNTLNGFFYHCIRDGYQHLVETCLMREKIKPGRVGCPWVHNDSGDYIFGVNYNCCLGKACPLWNHTGYFSDQLYKYPACISHQKSKVLKNQKVQSQEPQCTEKEISTQSFLDGFRTMNHNYSSVNIYVHIVISCGFAIFFVLAKPYNHRHEQLNDTSQQLRDFGENQIEDPGISSKKVFFSLLLVQLPSITTFLKHFNIIISSGKNQTIVKDLILWIIIVAATFTLVITCWRRRKYKHSSKVERNVKVTLIMIWVFISICISMNVAHEYIYHNSFIDALTFLLILLFFILQSLFQWHNIVVSEENVKIGLKETVLILCANCVLCTYTTIHNGRFEYLHGIGQKHTHGNKTNNFIAENYFENSFPSLLSFIPGYSFISTVYMYHFLVKYHFKKSNATLKIQRRHINTKIFVLIQFLMMIITISGTSAHACLKLFLPQEEYNGIILDIVLSAVAIAIMLMILSSMYMSGILSTLSFSFDNVYSWDTMIVLLYIAIGISRLFQTAIIENITGGVIDETHSLFELFKGTLSFLPFLFQTFISIIFSTLSKDKYKRLLLSYTKKEMLNAIYCLIFINTYTYITISSNVPFWSIQFIHPTKFVQHLFLQFMILLESLYCFAVSVGFLCVIFKQFEITRDIGIAVI